MTQNPPASGPKRLWLRRLLALGALALGLLLGVSGYFSSVLLFPRPFRCKVKHFHYCGTPAQQKLAFEEVEFRASDGFRLKGWWIPAPPKAQGKPSRAIIFSHGRGADRREGMRWAMPLHQAGFSLLAFDYRNCGQSQKSFNSMGFHERKDLVAAVDFAKQTQKIQKIGVMGFSLGAAIAILVTAKDRRIDALLTEGGFSHVIDVIAERGKLQYRLPYYPLIPMVMAVYSWRAGLDTSALHPEQQIPKISPRPVYIIHGGADEVVFPSHGRRLFRAAKKPKSLWIVPNGLHIDAWQREKTKAVRTVVHFFSRHLKKDAPPKP